MVRSIFSVWGLYVRRELFRNLRQHLIRNSKHRRRLVCVTVGCKRKGGRCDQSSNFHQVGNRLDLLPPHNTRFRIQPICLSISISVRKRNEERMYLLFFHLTLFPNKPQKKLFPPLCKQETLRYSLSNQDSVDSHQKTFPPKHTATTQAFQRLTCTARSLRWS